MEPADLYGLPLDEFTPRRNSLAKDLRRDGQRDEAERVSKLRKPSVAAWAVNQLVRTQRRELAALFKAGDALQKAQDDLLAGRGDPHVLRSAVDAERSAVDRLADRARGLLSSEGQELSPARLEQVTETLHAAALDPDARSALQDGRLERELRHVGLGAPAAGGLGAPAASGPEAPAAGGPGAPAAGRPGARGAGGSARLRTKKPVEGGAKPKRPAAELRREATAARRRLERAGRDLEAAEQRRQRAEAALRHAEDGLHDAEERLARAREAVTAAEREDQQDQTALG